MEKYIYNFFTKTKGVVSVFMVIVMVPLVTACSMYVDACRIKLARSVVYSSGDLALNSVLSNFDADLAEIYGLMASAQDNSQAVENAKKYFKKTMVSQGLDERYADDFSNAVGSLLDGGDIGNISDLLGIETNEVKISPVANGTLCNPAILKDQIVEFMKYRGPVEGVEELWGKFTEIKNTVNDSKEVSKLTKDASNYYEKQKDAMSALEEAYKNLLNYNDVENKLPYDSGKIHWKSGINSGYISTIKTYVTGTNEGSIRASYKTFHHNYVYDLANYQGRVYKKESITTASQTKSKISDSKVSKKTLNNLRTLIDGGNGKGGFVKTFQNYAIAANTFANFISQYTFKSSMHPVQYWIQTQAKINSEGGLSNFLSLYDGYDDAKKSLRTGSIAYKMALINKIAEKLDPSELNKEEDLAKITKSSGGKVTITYVKQSYKDAIEEYNKLVNAEYGGNLQNKYNEISQKLLDINAEKNRVDTEKNNLVSGVDKFSKKLNGYITKLSEAAVYLTKAKSALDDAADKVGKMYTSYETWKSDYKNSDIKSSESREDAEEKFKQAEKDIKELGLTQENVKEFSARVGNSNSLIGSVKDAIKKLKYNSNHSNVSKSVSDINDIVKFSSASGIGANKVTMFTNDLKNLDADFNMSVPDSSAFSVTNKNNPDFTVNQPELYDWMKKKFVDKNGKPVDPRKKDKDREKSEDDFNDKDSKEKETTSKVDTSGNKNSKKEIYGQESLPSSSEEVDGGISTSKKNTKNITHMADSANGLFKDFGDSIVSARDKLYVLLYITTMFSYDTYSAEKDRKKEDNKGEEGKYERCTLTNVEISNTNNYTFGNEIEYILYGGENSSNKTASYGTIFAIRYVIDLLYAIVHFWNNPTLEGFASGIQAATCGIIPIPLTKLVVILGLTAMEAGNDISILKEGRPLAVIKSKDTWKYEFDITNLAKSSTKDVNTANKQSTFKFYYSDYLKLILMFKLISSENAILKRTADVIQVNMSLKQEGFKLSKSRVYYQLSATCKNPILMLALPVVKNDLKQTKITVKPWNEYSIQLIRGY